MFSFALLSRLTLCVAAVAILTPFSKATDWPMWRYDAGRTAATPHELPDKLHRRWIRIFPTLKPAWPEDQRLQFDASYEPIVMGKSMFVASSHNDSITALNTDTGKIRWRYFAEGPVRFAPVAHDGRIYFGADDGRFYCLDAIDGKLIRKFGERPDRQVLGNGRLISVWPVRGGPVLTDGRLYFTTGIWPFEGSFLCSVDVSHAEDKNTDRPDNGSSVQGDYNAQVLMNSAPQGNLVAAEGKLLIPRGRALPLCLDRLTNEVERLQYTSRGKTDFHVVSVGNWVFHGSKIYNRVLKTTLDVEAYRPVVTPQVIYTASNGIVQALDLAHPEKTKRTGRRGEDVEDWTLPELWQLPIDIPSSAPKKTEEYEAWSQANPVHVCLKAGNRLYGHRAGFIFGVELPQNDVSARVVWMAQVEGTPSSMLAADEKLFVVTHQGDIHCFSASKNENIPRQHESTVELKTRQDVWSAKADEILRITDVQEGYGIVLGLRSGRLLEELVARSSLQFIAIDSDLEKVNAIRQRFDTTGLYGQRVAIHHGDPLNFALPPYLANLIVSENFNAEDSQQRKIFVDTTFRSLRPYGGVACFDLQTKQHEYFKEQVNQNQLSQAEVHRQGSLSLLRRVGALPGSANWTHEYGDTSNTLMSPDEGVRAPLGVLWYGGPAGSGELFYDRHAWPPSPQVIDGRMFIQGPGKLTAVDIYTGRILWQKALTDGVSPGRHGLEAPIGYHFVAGHDALYLAYPKSCLWLDPTNGEQLGEFKLPSEDDRWGRIRLLEDLLIVPVFRKNLPEELFAIETRDGTVRWSKKARHGFPILATSDNKVFCFDGNLKDFYGDAYRRRGPWAPSSPKYRVPESSEEKSLVALNARTGNVIWSHSIDFVATWLAYSQEHDVVVVSNGEGILACNGKHGKPLWQQQKKAFGFGGILPKLYGPQLGFGHPESMMDKVILWHDWVIDQRGPGRAYNLLNGEPVQLPDPVTGRSCNWGFTKGGHFCSYAIAGEHLLTFRGRTAALFDMHSGGTAHLVGFRSGCRNNLIPANGLLNVPNFSEGCICSFSIYTSLALVHQPESELWTYNILKKDSDATVQRIGINFGALGDRRDENGTLWVDYPNVGGPSPEIEVSLKADQPQWFRYHVSQIQGDGLNWIAASGVKGIQSVTIPLVVKPDPPRRYTVRLHFMEPELASPEQRLFHVALQEQTVLEDFDLVTQSGVTRSAIVREFNDIEVSHALTVSFTSKTADPLICGIEIVPAKPSEPPPE